VLTLWSGSVRFETDPPLVSTRSSLLKTSPYKSSRMSNPQERVFVVSRLCWVSRRNQITVEVDLPGTAQGTGWIEKSVSVRVAP
jgi:hypothetical protein